jgi:branched-chain amino acid transport system ATP-binding protein
MKCLDLYKAIRAITESQDLTVLLVEQDIGLALSMSGRGYVLENGRIVSQGEAKTLLSNKQIREAYLGTRSK